MYRSLVYSGFFAFCIVPLCVILFMIEYYALKNDIAHLQSMIAAYKIRIHILDNAIDGSSLCASCSINNDNEYESSVVSQDQSTQPFIPLNRDVTYLKNSTSHFFKAQELGNLLSHIDHQQKIAPSKLSSNKNSTLSKKRVTQKRNRQRYTRHAGSGILQWPIQSDKFWLSSLYGPRRKHDGSIGFHYGIDMAAVKGTPVMAAAHGVVTEAHYAGGFGNSIVIRHTNNLSSRYAHLNSVRVKHGQKVYAGTIIGTVGETGHIRKKTKDGSHLHFEVFEYNRRINPLTLLPPVP